MKKEKQKTKSKEIELRIQNCDLKIENNNLKKTCFWLIKQNCDLQNEIMDKEIEISNLKLKKINLNSWLKQIYLTIKEDIKYFSILENSDVIESLEFLLNQIESWIEK